MNKMIFFWRIIRESKIFSIFTFKIIYQSINDNAEASEDDMPENIENSWIEEDVNNADYSDDSFIKTGLILFIWSTLFYLFLTG